MVFYNMGVCRPSAARYFLCGIIVGVVFGVLIMTINRKWPNYNLRLNRTNASNPKKSCSYPVVDLYNEVKVLCWIMTGPQNHETRARHVKNTWGKRCNILVFMSTKKDPSLPSIALPVVEDRRHLWGKTKEAFKYIYKHYYDEADWFFKADDDTYAIMENMRYMLSDKNTSDPVYYGFRFKPLVRQGYMSGGAGYVLSKESLRRFIDESVSNPKKCEQSNTGDEDKEMGKCLQAVGVTPGDTRDQVGKARFMPLFIQFLLGSGTVGLPNKNWLWSYTYYPLKRGMECCSNYIITTHYCTPHLMYLLEYLIYHVKPYGVPYDTISDNIHNIATSTNATISIVSVRKMKSPEIGATKKDDANWDDYD